MALKVRVLAFSEGETIPKKFTCEGENVSPPVEWSEAPDNTKSFVLICDDPDAPMGVWNHWLLWDIPPGVTALAERFTPGGTGVTGINDFGNPGYGGPCPPKGHGPHRYFFKVFAMDTERLGLKAGSRRTELDRAMRGHVMGEAWAMGRYERR